MKGKTLTIDNIDLIRSNKFFTKTIIKWLIFGLIYYLISGWRLGLIFLLILGLINGLIGDKIEAIETIKFSYHIFKNGLMYGLMYGLILGIFLGFSGLEIENKTIPNQGIWESAKNTVKLSA